ncbi:MAG: DUF4124 domain-containing protein [Thiohalobacteraceae bacterium]
MNHARRIVRLAGFATLLGVAVVAQTATLYSWTDADGVRHFSESPPEHGDAPVDTIELEDLPSAAPDAQERLDNIRAVARDLERARQQREQERAQAEPERQPATPAVEPEPVPRYNPYPYAYPYAYPYPPGYGRPAPFRPWTKPDPPKRPTKPKAPAREDAPRPPGARVVP